MAKIWADVLRVEKIGIDDNFFELGGNSLLAVQMISRLRSRFGCDLGLRALFEAPSIALLAPRIKPTKATPAPIPRVATQRVRSKPCCASSKRPRSINDTLRP